VRQSTRLRRGFGGQAVRSLPAVASAQAGPRPVFAGAGEAVLAVLVFFYSRAFPPGHLPGQGGRKPASPPRHFQPLRRWRRDAGTASATCAAFGKAMKPQRRYERREDKRNGSLRVNKSSEIRFSTASAIM
jgi:hypothetical protein